MPYFAENQPNARGEFNVGYYDDAGEFVIASVLKENEAKALANAMQTDLDSLGSEELDAAGEIYDRVL